MKIMLRYLLMLIIVLTTLSCRTKPTETDPPQDQCATPTFSPAGGGYVPNSLGYIQVNIFCSTPGTTIYYSANSGQAPNVRYSGSAPVYIKYKNASSPFALRAKATKSGYIDSPIATASYWNSSLDK